MVAIEKLLTFILFFSILIVIKEIILFGMAWAKGDHVDFSVARQITLASAISYILTIIFTGFTII